MKRLLIVGCSATKDPAAGLLPALDRYRGAYYQMIRQVPAGELPEIVILSAELGFIRADLPIEDYDRRLTKARAAELLGRKDFSHQLFYALDGLIYDEVMIAAGWLYRDLIDKAIAKIEATAIVYFGRKGHTSGGIGTQRSQLKAWLNQGRG